MHKAPPQPCALTTTGCRLQSPRNSCFRREFPDFHHAASPRVRAYLTTCFQLKVARATRSWATSQMARRVDHARRRGTVKRPTRCRRRFFSFRDLRPENTQICNDAAPWGQGMHTCHLSRTRMNKGYRYGEWVAEMDSRT